MKRSIYWIMLLFTTLVGCKKEDSDKDGAWSRSADFEGEPRNGAFVFTIDNKAYVGTGYDGDDRFNDVWMFDGDKKTWYPMAVFPGKARSNGVAFTINEKGYFGTGYDGDTALKDFWEYTPSTNSWRKIADMPINVGRYDAVAFSLNNKGYVGTGKDNDSKEQSDFYSYDPNTDTWKKENSLTVKRSGAFTFTVNGNVYVGGGTNNGSYTPELYEFNPVDGSWIIKRDLNRFDDDDNDEKNDDDNYDLSRSNTMAFTIGGNGYITCGMKYSALNDTWRYDPVKDFWTQVDTFEGTNRAYGVAFTIKNLAYVTTGNNGSTRLDDTWVFDPNAVDDDD
ncbi:kelch repeat-containing protein [Mucilaginibacter sp. OK283]|uniref:Kelch repeat-containing protein n=1 Tax=Mucilaginibacter sp. OK283 TaxID=1881049 RepID=UPI0015A56EF6|nr:kelch repeat-containing protein [Mucilaginibacter sp. OK283]